MTVAQAQAAMTKLAADFERAFPEANRGRRLQVNSARAFDGGLRAPVEGFFAVVLAVTALVLFTACANLANLLLVRAVSRRREIAIRLALGAQPRDALRLVISYGMKLTLLGLACGLLGSLLAARAMRGMLFGVGANDPATFIVIACLLAFTALLACYLPARRATKVDPIVALRHE